MQTLVREAEAELGRPTTGFDLRHLRRFGTYLAPELPRTFLALGLMVATSLGQLVGPAATAVAFDLFLRPGVGEGPASPSRLATLVSSWLARWGWEPEPAEGVVALALVWAVAQILTSLLLWRQGLVLETLGQRVLARLRRDVFVHLQRLDLSQYDQMPIGRLMARATHDVASLHELFTAGLVSVVGDLLLLGGIAAVLMLLDFRLALAAFSVLPALFVLTLWFKKRARESFREVRSALAAVNAFLQEHLSGMSVVQLFRQEQARAERFATVDAVHRDANIHGIIYYALYFPGVELLTACGVAIILAYGGMRALAGAISTGALVAFLQYAQRFYQPLADLAEKYQILQQALAASERIFELIDTKPSIVSPPQGFAPLTVKGRVEFREVRFAYRAGVEVLRGLSFTVEPGETVALVGATGAGKSTVANLILRFYDVSSGAVLVEGVDVRRWDLLRLREHVGLILQEPFLFRETVRWNLKFGSLEVPEAKLWEALEAAQAREVVDRLPAGLDTVLGERGAGLSTGEKQLLALARLLVLDPPIVLLDEATASIDRATEQRIEKALERVFENRTCLVIAHRLSTIQRADRILVLHQGRLVESGTHAELLAAQGIYARLLELQWGSSAARVAEERSVHLTAHASGPRGSGPQEN